MKSFGIWRQQQGASGESKVSMDEDRKKYDEFSGQEKLRITTVGGRYRIIV